MPELKSAMIRHLMDNMEDVWPIPDNIPSGVRERLKRLFNQAYHQGWTDREVADERDLRCKYVALLEDTVLRLPLPRPTPEPLARWMTEIKAARTATDPEGAAIEHVSGLLDEALKEEGQP